MKKSHLQRAGMLQVGAKYWLRVPPAGYGTPVFEKVRLVDITNCPAVVVVQDEAKDLIKCNRCDLYQYP